MSVMIPTLFSKLATCVDPFIYTLNQTQIRTEIFRHLRLPPSVNLSARATPYYQYPSRPLLNDNNSHRTLGSSQRQPTAGRRSTSPRVSALLVSGAAAGRVAAMNVISSSRQSSIRFSKDNRIPDSILYERTDEGISKSASFYTKAVEEDNKETKIDVLKGFKKQSSSLDADVCVKRRSSTNHPKILVQQPTVPLFEIDCLLRVVSSPSQMTNETISMNIDGLANKETSV